MAKHLLWVILLTICSQFLSGVTSESHLENTAKLLRSIGMEEMSEIFWEERVFQTRITHHPDLPDSVWNIVREEMDEKMTFFNSMIDFYATQFSEDEVKELIDIVGSELLQRFYEFMGNTQNMYDSTIEELFKKEFTEEENAELERFFDSKAYRRFREVTESSAGNKNKHALELGSEVSKRITKFLKERGFIE